jgi:hypothetical protein
VETGGLASHICHENYDEGSSVRSNQHRSKDGT